MRVSWRIPFILILTAFITITPTAHATECLSSASAVWAAHPGSHATWRLQLPGHIGEKCWFAASKNKVVDADASRDAAPEIKPVSAMAVPRPRPRFQDTLTAADRAPLPASTRPDWTAETRSILMWGTPMRIDASWDDLFAGRERRAE